MGYFEAITGIDNKEALLTNVFDNGK